MTICVRPCIATLIPAARPVVTAPRAMASARIMQIEKEAVIGLMGRNLPDAEGINLDMDQLEYLF
jgi:hypothetical protein